MFHGKLRQHARAELPAVLQRARACERVRTRGHALMTHPVNPRSFGMKFIALAHVTTYTRPRFTRWGAWELVGGPGNEASPFYSLGGLGTRLARAGAWERGFARAGAWERGYRTGTVRQRPPTHNNYVR